MAQHWRGIADAVGLDGDNPEHVQWVFQESLKRAAEFKITGVTYRLTQGKAGWIDASEKLRECFLIDCSSKMFMLFFQV